MVFASKTIQWLRAENLLILRRASPAVTTSAAHTSLTSIRQDRNNLSYPQQREPLERHIAHCHRSINTKDDRSVRLTCSQGPEQATSKDFTSTMGADKVTSPVDVAHTQNLLEFINAAWTPYHAVGKALPPALLCDNGMCEILESDSCS